VLSRTMIAIWVSDARKRFRRLARPGGNSEFMADVWGPLRQKGRGQGWYAITVAKKQPPQDIRGGCFKPSAIWSYSAARFAGRANSVEKAYGTRICAILDVSPHR
jgi:hypothetical protein